MPPGAVLTTEFFAPWFADVRRSTAWTAFLDAVPEQWPERCAELEKVVEGLSWTPAQLHALAELEELLPRRSGEGFAVRSSAPDEDDASASFAGGYASRLGVPAHGLRDAIRRCCASALDARVFAYKRESGLDVSSPRLAVIVQQQLASDVAGVGFSLNPLTNDHDEAVIDASRGLGEAVVSGRLTPDHWVVDKVTRAVLERQTGAKPFQIVLAVEGGVRETTSPHPNELSLTDAQVSELTDLIVRLEVLFGHPVDVEWAYANDSLHVLQARPITRYVPLPPELATAPGERRRLYVDAALSKGLTMNAPVSVLGLEATSAEETALAEKLERGVPGNVVVEMGFALHRLAHLVDRSEFDDSSRLAERIERRQMSIPFLHAWDDFAARFGCRGPQETDLASPRYADDPRLMLQQMAPMAVAGGLDLEARHRLHARERQEAYHALARRFGPLRRALLRRLFRVNELFAGSRDTPKYFAVLGNYVVRRRALADGQQLVEAGRLDAAAHVFDLTFADLRAALDDPALDLRRLREDRIRFTRKLAAHVRTFPP